MSSRVPGSRWITVVAVVLAPAFFAEPTIAQPAGTVRGQVVDLQGRAVDGAMVVFDFQGAGVERVDVTTNSDGEFSQRDLSDGHYTVTAQKQDVGRQSFRLRVRPGQTVEVNFLLQPRAGPALWRDDLPGREALTEVFEEGVAANRAGDFEQAITKFEEVLGSTPACIDCHYNIGIAYTRMEDYAAAAAAFKKVLDIRPDFAAGYYALADVYNRQERFDEAATARSEANRIAVEALAAGRERTQNTLNQGIIFWNAGNVADAKRRFEEAAKLDPTHADVHYWLGMANTTEGNRAEAARSLRRYLDLAPDGQYADSAADTLKQIGR